VHRTDINYTNSAVLGALYICEYVVHDTMWHYFLLYISLNLKRRFIEGPSTTCFELKNQFVVEYRETNLMSLALLLLYLIFNMFRKLIRPSSGACDICVELFHGLYCSGSMCLGVMLWHGSGGVVSVRRLNYYCLYFTILWF